MADMFGGTAANFAFTGFNLSGEEWSVSLAGDAENWSEFGDFWKKAAVSRMQINGSASGQIKFNEAASTPFPTNLSQTSVNNVAATLTADNGCTISGLFAVTIVDITRPSGGRATGRITFSSNGAPTFAWDQTV